MDTAVALATPWGRSALAMLRLSGPQALAIAQQLCPQGPPWKPRRASLRQARDAQDRILDEAVVVWMPAPHTLTGEAVVELCCHGNPVIISLLLDRLVALGARPARPGEFTRRALLNGKMSLLEAEALDGLIRATSPEGILLARAGMQGEIDALAAALREALLDVAAELEARLDHPEEDLSLEDDAQVCARLEAIARQAGSAAQSWRAGRIRLEGAAVALVGPVNAGKSSLFNRLLGQRRALVSPLPGTTRDVVESTLLIAGVSVRLLDTAGAREETTDPLEAEGIALGQDLTADVDLRLLLVPLHQPPSSALLHLLEALEGSPHLRIGTFGDLPRSPQAPPVDLALSNVTGEGLPALHAAIAERLGQSTAQGERHMVLSQRQHDRFREIALHAQESIDALVGLAGPAVAAEAVTAALERLAELTGEDAREAVLDRLFERFCIGK